MVDIVTRYDLIRSTPQWMGTSVVDPKHTIPGGIKVDTAQFPREDVVTVVVSTAGAALNATSVPISAAPGPIPSGTILDFTGAGKYAKLTVAVAKGDTTLTVEALPQALVSTDSATYAGVKNRRLLLSGTFVGRTQVERTAGTGYGPASASDDQYALVNYDYDLEMDDTVAGYQPLAGNVVYENFLPGFSTMPSALLAKLRANYFCVTARD